MRDGADGAGVPMRWGERALRWLANRNLARVQLTAAKHFTADAMVTAPAGTRAYTLQCAALAAAQTAAWLCEKSQAALSAGDNDNAERLAHDAADYTRRSMHMSELSRAGDALAPGGDA